MNTGRNIVFLMLLSVLGLAACDQGEDKVAPSPDKAVTAAPAPVVAEKPAVKSGSAHKMVFFIAPADGAELKSPVRVNFVLIGMELAPAGRETPNSGHHHLLVDVDELPAADQPIPADEHHIHFGKGQNETMLELAPGEHKLQLILGDKNHQPHNPPLV